jgi:hypothetical protein
LSGIGFGNKQALSSRKEFIVKRVNQFILLGAQFVMLLLLFSISATSAFSAPSKYTTQDGWTVWHLDHGSGGDRNVYDMGFDPDWLDSTYSQIWMAHNGGYCPPSPGCPNGDYYGLVFLAAPGWAYYEGFTDKSGAPGGYKVQCWTDYSPDGCGCEPFYSSFGLSGISETIGLKLWIQRVIQGTLALCPCPITVYWLEVRAKVGFQVLSHSPADRAKNVDPSGGISVQFTGEYQQATLNNNTFKLEYRDHDGAWKQVAGNIIKGLNNFSFYPNAELKDGVRYRATVVGGQGGVKRKEGKTLNADVQWHFWTAPKLDLRDYGGFLCPPSAGPPCPGVELAVFQVARNAAMVPGGKPAVGRLYIRWAGHLDVLEEDQLQEFEVKALMTVEGKKYETRQTVKRYSRYTLGELVYAGNTINFYHTAINNFSYTAEVVPQPNGVHYLTPTLDLGSTIRSPRIEFDYYFSKDGDWAGGVPKDAQLDGIGLIADGSRYITAQFPVLGTDWHGKGEYSIGYTHTGPTLNDADCGSVKEVACPSWIGNDIMPEWQCIFEKYKTLLGGHKFVAVTVPKSICPAATAFTRKRQVLFHLSGNGANNGTIAHEAGHIYGISTADNPDEGHRNPSEGVEGFQVGLRINRSHVENPDQAISLMHESEQPTNTQWIDNEDYGTLLSTATGGLRTRLQGPAGPYLIVSGHINAALASADFSPAFLQELPNDPPSASGPYLVELLDSGGAVLAGDYVTPGIEVTDGGPRPDPTGPQYFSVSLPWNEAAVGIRVRSGGTTIGTLTRSPHAPSVDFSNLLEGEALSGSKTLNWIGSDADGPNLAYQVQFSADNGVQWRPLTVLTGNTAFDLDTTRLPSGSGLKLRLMVTDGFNTGYATRTVTISNPLKVAGVLPTWSSTDAVLTAPVQAFFVTGLDPATLQGGGFQLLANGSNLVAGVVTYDTGLRMAVFTPAAPLQPSTAYTARLAAGVQDLQGHGLGSDYTWSFTTVPDIVAPLVQTTSPATGDLDVPPNSLVGGRFNEPLHPATVTAASFQLLDSNGQTVPGTVTYDVASQRALFQPAAALAASSTYTASLTTAITDLAGNPLEKPYQWRFTTGSTLSKGVRLTGNYLDQVIDDKGDGLYERLNINVEIEVLTPGTYTLSGRLLTSSGSVLGWNSTTATLDGGIHTLALTFGSLSIRGAAVNGPYILDAVYLVNTSDPTMADMKGNAYQTFAYDVAGFYGLSLGPIPDQFVELNTSREPAFNLRDYTARPGKTLTEVTYIVEVNTDPRVGLSLGPNGEVNIHPEPNLVTSSLVWIKASDPDGNSAWAKIGIYVQAAIPYAIHATYTPTMAPNTSQVITGEIVDQWDRLWTGEITVNFWSSVGTVDPKTVVTSTGRASTTFSPGNAVGTAEVDISVDKGPLKENYISIGGTGPVATTNAASGLTTSGATLNGTVNANNGSTAVTFQYGLTKAYGSTVTADQSPVTGDSDTPVSKGITGLSADTTYHYRVVAASSAGTTNGGDQAFKTLGAPSLGGLIYLPIILKFNQ